MALNNTTSLGGVGSTAASIVAKDMTMDVVNVSRDDNIISDMQKSVPMDDTQKIFTIDENRAPGTNAHAQGAAVVASAARSDTRKNYFFSSQILTATIATTRTADAVKQAGGSPTQHNKSMSLVELMNDWELQCQRGDSSSIQVSSGTQRTGSMYSYAGTTSVNGTVAQNSASADISSLIPKADGDHYYSGGTNQGFASILLKQLVSVHAGRNKTAFDTLVVPTSLRTVTTTALLAGNSSVNNWNMNASEGKVHDSVSMFYMDFLPKGLMIKDTWIADQTGGAANSMLLIDSSVARRGVLTGLTQNTDVAANIDGNLLHFVMEAANYVTTQSGVAALHNISASATAASANRSSSNVNRAKLAK